MLSGKHHIYVPKGSNTPFTWCGNIQIQLSLPLNNVLHVPKLSHNLVSIRELTQDLSNAVTLFHSHCVFKDLATGKTIRVAKERAGLYCHIRSIGKNEEVPNKRRSLLVTRQGENLQLQMASVQANWHPPFSVVSSLDNWNLTILSSSIIFIH